MWGVRGHCFNEPLNVLFHCVPLPTKKSRLHTFKKKNYILIRLVFFLNFLFAPYVKKKTPPTQSHAVYMYKRRKYKRTRLYVNYDIRRRWQKRTSTHITPCPLPICRVIYTFSTYTVIYNNNNNIYTRSLANTVYYSARCFSLFARWSVDRNPLKIVTLCSGKTRTRLARAHESYAQ